MNTGVRSLTLTLTLVAVLAAGSLAQTKTKQMVFDAGSAFFIQGLGALVLDKDGRLVVEMMPQKEQMPKELRGIDLNKDDEIMMFNGKRVKTIDDLREQYDALEVGQEVKFGVKNQSGMKIVSFEKPSGEQSGGAVMMMTTTVGDDEPGGDEHSESKIIGPDGREISVTPVFDAGIMLTEVEDGVQIAMVMPDAKDKLHGDLPSGGEQIVTVNGSSAEALSSFKKMYDATPEGEKVTLVYSKDGTEYTCFFSRSNDMPSSGAVVERKIEK
ncbi:PDZ domain-containing protein [bacterium]|nr:PDZ domain-containing protein [bacterium]